MLTPKVQDHIYLTLYLFRHPLLPFTPSNQHSIVCVYEFVFVCFVGVFVTFCFLFRMSGIISFLSFPSDLFHLA